MKDEISGIETISLVSELKQLVDCKVQKVYHTRSEILFQLYSASTKEKVLRIVPGKTMHITDYRKEHPTYPSHFCMYMRKYLTGAVVRYIIQPGTERIVKIGFHTDRDYVLIVELFSKGNVILCDGETIMQPLMVQVWRDRTIKPKEKYVFPPPKPDLSALKPGEFSRIVTSTSKSDVVRALASDLGLGGPYAEECCKRAGIQKSKPADDLTEEELAKLHTALSSLVRDARKPQGFVIFRGEPLDVVPFEMEIYSGLTKKTFPTFNAALDFYFTTYISKETEELDKLEAAKKQMMHRLETQKGIIEEYGRDAEKARKIADTVKSNLYEIKKVCSSLLAARESYPWDRIIRIVESEKTKGVPEAMMIKQIKPDEGTVVLETEPEVEMPFTSDPADVMEEYYSQAKKFESKIEGAKNFIKETELELKKLSLVKAEAKEPEKIEKPNREWYESYRWFISSEGFLVISGRDATQNEVIIKKYLEPADLVFHADIQGSPFSIVKNGRESGEKTRLEAAKQTVSYSKVWSLGYGSGDAYYVQPYQVTKQAPPGEYVPRGSFMVNGKKTYFKDLKPEVAIGVSKEFRVIGGPREAIAKNARYFVLLVPGDTSTGTTANQVKEAIAKHVPEAKGLRLEEFQTFVPGSSRMVKS